MMKTIATFFVLTLIVGSAFAQEPDTLMYAQGNIVNGTTKEPITASVSYQSLPLW
ncbi:MAG: hypothetical protein WDO15_12450 [Bacteroidota bacterium]